MFLILNQIPMLPALTTHPTSRLRRISGVCRASNRTQRRTSADDVVEASNTLLAVTANLITRCIQRGRRFRRTAQITIIGCHVFNP